VAYFVGKHAGNKKVQGDYKIYGIPNIICDTYFFKITTGSGSVIKTPAGSYPGLLRKKVKILIDGVAYAFLACTDWVNAASATASASVSPTASRSPSASASQSPSPSHV